MESMLFVRGAAGQKQRYFHCTPTTGQISIGERFLNSRTEGPNPIFIFSPNDYSLEGDKNNNNKPLDLPDLPFKQILFLMIPFLQSSLMVNLMTLPGPTFFFAVMSYMPPSNLTLPVLFIFLSTVSHLLHPQPICLQQREHLILPLHQYPSLYLRPHLMGLH